MACLLNPGKGENSQLYFVSELQPHLPAPDLLCVPISLCRREHLTPEDLQKNKAMMENLTKGNIVENCDVSSAIV